MKAKYEIEGHLLSIERRVLEVIDLVTFSDQHILEILAIQVKRDIDEIFKLMGE